VFKVFTVGAAGSVGCLAVTVCFVSVVSTVSFVFPVDGNTKDEAISIDGTTNETVGHKDAKDQKNSQAGLEFDL
jgi:hypothetical protein